MSYTVSEKSPEANYHFGDGDIADLLSQCMTLSPNGISLGLDRMARLLRDMDHPEQKLPPVIHVAGTNGKGSTVAFLRAMAKAAGWAAHAMTSPHLVRFNERLTIAGHDIDDRDLIAALRDTLALNGGREASFFELITAAGFLAFSRTSADLCIIETGLGGRLDATNVLDHPAACIIQVISNDHAHLLGDSLSKIALEKAGIMKPGVPCIIGPQTAAGIRAGVMDVFDSHGQQVGAPLLVHGRDWDFHETTAGFRVEDAQGAVDLPAPSLPGAHQIGNAAAAVVAWRALGYAPAALPGIARAVWPARMQRLRAGPLCDAAGPDIDIWLDGAHNDSAGDMLNRHLDGWRDRPVFLITGFLRTKDPASVVGPFMSHLSGVWCVPIEGQPMALAAVDVRRSLEKIAPPGLAIHESPDVMESIRRIRDQNPGPCRVLIAGSLYLAGTVLQSNR